MGLTHFPCGLILRGYKLHVECEGELLLFNNEFVIFCINNQAQLSVHLSNDIYVSSDELNFYLFADDTNILYANKNLTS